MEIILAVATILGGITAIWFFWDKLKDSRSVVNRRVETIKEQATINVLAPNLANDERFAFGMLHVRDGKDQIPDHGPLLNQEVLPEIKNGSLTYKTEYSKQLGFQFKVFADYRGLEFLHAKELLEKEGFSSITSGGGKSARAWFILPKYEICSTNDGFTNNYYYPA